MYTKKKKKKAKLCNWKNIFLYFRSFIFPDFTDSMTCLEINFVCYVRPGIGSASFSTGASNSTKAKKEEFHDLTILHLKISSTCMCVSVSELSTLSFFMYNYIFIVLCVLKLDVSPLNLIFIFKGVWLL